MKQGWEIKKLGEVCDIVGGSTPKTGEPSYWDGEHYWITPAELDGSKYISSTSRTITDEGVKSAHLQLLPSGTVLLSSRAPIGKGAITTAPMDCNQGFKNLVCSDKLYNEFAYWFLYYNTEYLNSLGTGATFKEISKRVVEQIPIPVPPREEQERIVEELDCLSGVIEKKREQLRELDALAESIFYQMFGDPNNSIYETRNLSDLSERKLSYGSGVSAVDFDGKIRYVRITDIKDDGELQDDKVSPNVFDDKYTLNDGDILFARSGATVGKTYQYKQKDGKAIYAGYLIRFIPNRNIVLPSYIFGYTKTNYYKAFISASAQAVAQPNINAQQYGALKVPIPPLTLQQEFADKIEAIEKQKELIKKSISETETLFNARMDYYFN